MRSAFVAAMAGAAWIPFGAAFGQTGFQPATELVAVEPPAPSVPVNAGPVILGKGEQYVLVLSADATHPYDRLAVTTDFVNIQELPLPANAIAPVFAGASEDGSRVVARVAFPAGDTFRACLWIDGAPNVLSVNSAPIQQPVALSADGASAVVNVNVGAPERCFLVSGGRSINVAPPFDPDDPQLRTHGTALSPDGLTVAGIYNGPSGYSFTWSEAGGWNYLVSPYAGQTLPVLVADGGVRVVQRPLPEAANGTPTYGAGRWSMIEAFNAKCMSRDGKMVLGASSLTGRATIWTETTGREDLRDALRARGIDVRGWTLGGVEYISADGRKIVGRGTAPGSSTVHWWVATVEPFAAADMGKAGGLGGSDGKLDNNDFIVFIDRFFAQDARADVGKAGGERGSDGVLDNNDFCAFIGLFFSGQS